MAYYSGQVASYQELLNVLVSACIENGYSYSNSILYKGNTFLRIIATTGEIDFFGRTSLTANETPNAVRIGQFGRNVIQPIVSFPMDYEIFIFEMEVFLIVKYGVDLYQWAAFGQSTLSLDGSGMFLGASTDNRYYSGWNGITISANGDVSSFQLCPALAFANSSYTSDSIARNFFINHGMDNDNWLPLFGTGPTLGVACISKLLERQPSTWSSEAILLPIQVYKPRSSNKNSLILDIQNARHIRIDNFEPGQVISFGEERWKVYPWYRKNTVKAAGGGDLTHTGTFGWAIRYDGP